MSKLAEQRRERLIELANKYYISIPTAEGHCHSSSEEDLQSYLYGEWHIDQWVAVTHHDDIYYLKTFTSREAAEERCIEFVSDDIFTESPVGVVDLDDPIEPYGRLYRLTQLIPIFEGS